MTEQLTPFGEPVVVDELVRRALHPAPTAIIIVDTATEDRKSVV